MGSGVPIVSVKVGRQAIRQAGKQARRWVGCSGQGGRLATHICMHASTQARMHACIMRHASCDMHTSHIHIRPYIRRVKSGTTIASALYTHLNWPRLLRGWSNVLSGLVLRRDVAARTSCVCRISMSKDVVCLMSTLKGNVLHALISALSLKS